MGITVVDVIEFAHKGEAKSIIKSPSVQRSSKSSSPDAASPLDAVGNAAMVFSMMRRALPHRNFFTIRLQHIIPVTAELKAKKQFLIEELADWLHAETKKPKWWIADILREWSNELPHKSAIEWAKDLDVTTRTLSRWGWERNPTSIYTLIQHEYDISVDMLADPMRERNWIWETQNVVDRKCLSSV